MRRTELRAGGRRLECAWIGRPEPGRPTLVLLHEGLGCVAMWRDFPQRLAAATGLPAFLYSRAGYGGSEPAELPRPVRFMHHEALEVLPELLAAAGIDTPLLVGHSDGASIALIAAGAGVVPGLQALALIAPHVFNEELCVTSIRAAAEAYRSKPRLREGLARYHGEQVDAAFWGWNDVWLHPDFWHWNIEEYLPGIEVPLLLVQGEDDQYGTIAQLEAIERQVTVPCTRVLIPAARHSPHLERPDPTLDALARFVAAAAGREVTPAGGAPGAG